MTGTAIARRSAEIIELNGRQIINTCRWNDRCVGDYLLANARDEWVEIIELARFVYNSGAPSNQDKIRQKIHKARKELMGRGELLLTEYGGPNRSASEVKIYNREANSEVERQIAREKVEQMKQRHDLTSAQYHAMIAILAA